MNHKTTQANGPLEALAQTNSLPGNIVKIMEAEAKEVSGGSYLVKIHATEDCTENEMDWFEFLERIKELNTVMELPCHDSPTHLGKERLEEFYQILKDEVDELLDVIDSGSVVGLSDLLGDVIVFCVSEAQRWGIPIGSVLGAIMDSQASKLVDGKPVPGELPGKFGKGPDFQPPEADIAKILFGDTYHYSELT